MRIPLVTIRSRFQISAADPAAFRKEFLETLRDGLDDSNMWKITDTEEGLSCRGALFRPHSLAGGFVNYIRQVDVSVKIAGTDVWVSCTGDMRHLTICGVTVTAVIWVGHIIAVTIGAPGVRAEQLWGPPVLGIGILAFSACLGRVAFATLLCRCIAVAGGKRKRGPAAPSEAGAER